MEYYQRKSIDYYLNELTSHYQLEGSRARNSLIVDVLDTEERSSKKVILINSDELTDYMLEDNVVDQKRRVAVHGNSSFRYF